MFEYSVVPGTPIGKRLTLLDSGGKRAVFFGSVAIQIYDADDKGAEAACIAMLSAPIWLPTLTSPLPSVAIATRWPGWPGAWPTMACRR